MKEKQFKTIPISSLEGMGFETIVGIIVDAHKGRGTIEFWDTIPEDEKNPIGEFRRGLIARNDVGDELEAEWSPGEGVPDYIEVRNHFGYTVKVYRD